MIQGWIETSLVGSNHYQGDFKSAFSGSRDDQKRANAINKAIHRYLFFSYTYVIMHMNHMNFEMGILS